MDPETNNQTPPSQPELIDHQHNGFDSTQVNFRDIVQKKFWVMHTIYGTDAATAGNYSTFFIAPMKCYVSAFQEVHAVLGTDGSAVTVGLEKLISTTAPGSGLAILTTDLSLKATINIVQTAILTTTLASRSLVAGDRLALKKTGTVTSVANVTVITELTIV